MANYIPVPSGYERLFQGPLDPSEHFSDLASLDDYLDNDGTAYKGQVVWVESESTIYMVDSLSAGGYTGIAFVDHDHTLSDITDAGTAAGKDVGTSTGDIPEVQADGEIPDSVLPSLSIGQVHPFSNDTLSDILNNEDLSNITAGDIVIADDDGSAGGPIQYIFTGGTKTSDTNYSLIADGSTDFSQAPDASESQDGHVELATQSETDSGSDDTRAVTPLKLKTWLLSHIFQGGESTKTSDPSKTRTVLLGDASSGLTEHAELVDIDGRIHMSGGSDFEVKGVNVGNLSDGDTFSSGTKVEEIIKQMLQKRVPPTYTDPTLNLTGDGNKLVEVGSNIAPTLQASWTKNDAGSLQELRFFKNGGKVDTQTSTPFEYNDSFQIAEEIVEYFSEVDYAEGAVKNDNFGDPYPSGHILAGTIQSNLVSYEGARRLFVGTAGSDITIGSSSDVRGLSATVRREGTLQSYNMLKPGNGNTFDIAIPSGTKSVVIAYPYDLGVLSKVIYVENSNQDVTATFTESQQSVEGANGFTAENYRVYKWTGDAAYPSDVTYRVTL